MFCTASPLYAWGDDLQQGDAVQFFCDDIFAGLLGYFIIAAVNTILGREVET